MPPPRRRLRSGGVICTGCWTACARRRRHRRRSRRSTTTSSASRCVACVRNALGGARERSRYLRTPAARAPDLRGADAGAAAGLARPDDRLDRAAHHRGRPRRPVAPVLMLVVGILTLVAFPFAERRAA